MLKKEMIISIAVMLMVVGTVYGKMGGGGGSCPDDTDAKIWTLDANGNLKDYFNQGEPVFLGGTGFDPAAKGGTYLLKFEVLDPDDNDAIEISGNVEVDDAGNIIPKKIWTIPQGDYPDHNYTVVVYSDTGCGGPGMCCGMIKAVKDDFTTIPEFPTVAIPAILAIGGGYLAIRMKRRKE